MNGSPKLPLILATWFLMLAVCDVAEACSCGGYPTTCGAYTGAEAVFIGTVRKVEQLNLRKDEEDNAVSDGQIAHVLVEQVFKNMQQTEVVFRSHNSSCDAVYKEGQRWLFYAYYDRKDRAWGIRACDRSTLIADAAEDLLYLQGLPESAQKTRLSGTLVHYEDGPEAGFRRVAPLGGVRVKIAGAQKTSEALTNTDGAFEVYGLPPGSYAVEPDVPAGLKIRFPIYYGEADGSDEKTIKLVLKEKSCAAVTFIYSAATSISGRVLGADRRPLPDVCLSLMPPDKIVRGNWNFDCTDEQGRYELKEIPPGRYIIVVNDDDKISSKAPFRTAYYPGVFERAQAELLNISEGSNLKDVDILIPSQEPTRVISGVLRYSDGRPVAGEFVEFKADAVKEPYDDEAHTKTDAQGRFSLTVLQRLKGWLRGSMYTYKGEYVNCPQLDRIIEKMDERVPALKTKPVRVEINDSMQDVNLFFPFPYCVKAKRE